MDVENISALLDWKSEVGETVNAIFTFAPAYSMSAMKQSATGFADAVAGAVCELTSPISPTLLWLGLASLG